MTAIMTLGLASAIAGLYVVTTYLMKVHAGLPVWVFAPVLACTLVAAIVLEIHLLKTERMGSIFMLILSLEVVLTVICARWLLGETYSPREIAGLGVIVFGIAVVWWPGKAGDAVARERNSQVTVPVSIEMPRVQMRMRQT